MPFASDKQRKFLFIKKPEVAEKFSKHKSKNTHKSDYGKSARDMARKKVY